MSKVDSYYDFLLEDHNEIIDKNYKPTGEYERKTFHEKLSDLVLYEVLSMVTVEHDVGDIQSKLIDRLSYEQMLDFLHIYDDDLLEDGKYEPSRLHKEVVRMRKYYEQHKEELL
jgi:hypothetical protein